MVTPTGENCGPCPRKLGVVNFVSDHLGWMMDGIKKTCGHFFVALFDCNLSGHGLWGHIL